MRKFTIHSIIQTLQRAENHAVEAAASAKQPRIRAECASEEAAKAQGVVTNFIGEIADIELADFKFGDVDITTLYVKCNAPHCRSGDGLNGLCERCDGVGFEKLTTFGD